MQRKSGESTSDLLLNRRKNVITCFILTLVVSASVQVNRQRSQHRNISHINQFINAHDHTDVSKYSEATLPNFYSTLTSSNSKAQRRTYGESNVIFIHQNKAAGSTIKSMLQARCDSMQGDTTCHDSGFRDYQAGRSWQALKFRFFERKHIDPATQYIDEGCYSWGMCHVLNRISERNCAYITVFREPKDRLVSAFIYCIYRQPKDQCCGWNRLLEDQNYANMNHKQQFLARANTTIRQFARHWGSFGFRQFLINDRKIDYENIVGTPALLWPAWHAIGKFRSHQIAHYYVTKGQILGEDGLDTTNTEGGRKRLDAVKNQLRKQLAVVGIVERWNETVASFVYKINDDLLNYAFGWKEFSTSVKSVNVMPPTRQLPNGIKQLSASDVRASIEDDSEVDLLLNADQVLYDFALSLFEEQMQKYSSVRT